MGNIRIRDAFLVGKALERNTFILLYGLVRSSNALVIRSTMVFKRY